MPHKIRPTRLVILRVGIDIGTSQPCKWSNGLKQNNEQQPKKQTKTSWGKTVTWQKWFYE